MEDEDDDDEDRRPGDVEDRERAAGDDSVRCTESRSRSAVEALMPCEDSMVRSMAMRNTRISSLAWKRAPIRRGDAAAHMVEHAHDRVERDQKQRR